MKKLAIAGLLAAALSLTAMSEQRAAAWGGCPGGFNFGLNVGINVSACWSFSPACCQQPCCPPGFCWGYQDCGYPACSYGDMGYPVAAGPAPVAAPAAPAAVQNAAYTYPAGYGYAPYQVPSYWYGR